MPNKLKVKRLDEVSFVDKGASPGARIAIWKRDVSPTKETKVKDTVTKRVEQRGMMWVAFDDEDKEIGEFESKEEAEAAAYKSTKRDDMATETVSKAEVEALTKRLEDAEKRARDAEAKATETEALAKRLEHEKRRTVFIAKAQALSSLPGVTGDDTGALLHEIADGLGQTDEGKAR